MTLTVPEWRQRAKVMTETVLDIVGEDADWERVFELDVAEGTTARVARYIQSELEGIFDEAFAPLRAENQRLRAYVTWLDSNSTRAAGAVRSFKDFLRNVGGPPPAPPDASAGPDLERNHWRSDDA